jgi:hypothetical protein
LISELQFPRAKSFVARIGVHHKAVKLKRWIIWKKTKSQSRAKSEEFRLVFVEGGVAPASAELWSPLLDPAMHGGLRAVGVAFGDSSEETRSGKAVVDSFQLASMTEYLRNQKSVRRELERALDEHRVDWRLTNLPGGSGAWKRVRVSCLLFEARDIVTRAQLARLDKRARERLLSKSDTPDTRSRFTVVLDSRTQRREPSARPWNDGHQRMCVFRDGKLLEFLIEG